MAAPVIMIIDDSQTIRRSAEMFLSKEGYDVRAFDDGFEGLSAIEEVGPAMIFMDLMMPGLDGYQTARLLKSNPKFASIPIVILSSKDGLFDRAQSKLAGCEEHLAKPFTKNALVEAVARHVKAIA